MSDLFWTVLVSAIVSGLVSHYFKRKEMKHSAEIDYQYEQKKKLSELVGAHYGRLIGSTARFNQRMWNLYDHHDKGWTEVKGSYSNTGYYFRSFVFRFLELISVLRAVERASIHLDTRVAKPEDFNFINYVLAMSWIMTDIDLFKDVRDEDRRDFDHFYSDNLRSYSDIVCENGEMPTFEGFDRFIDDDSAILRVLDFFNGLRRDEARDRWDRLVCLHLIQIAFLNSFGAPRYRTSQNDIKRVISQFAKDETRVSLHSRIVSYDLDKDQGMKDLAKAFSQTRAPHKS